MCVGGGYIEGIEYTKEALEIAKKRNSNVIYKQGDIYDLPKEKYDIVVCTEVLEHLEKPEAAVRSLYEAATKCVIITVPHEPWFCLGNLLALKNVSRFGNPQDHINHWTRKGFGIMLKNSVAKPDILSGSFPWSIAVYNKKK